VTRPRGFSLPTCRQLLTKSACRRPYFVRRNDENQLRSVVESVLSAGSDEQNPDAAHKWHPSPGPSHPFVRPFYRAVAPVGLIFPEELLSHWAECVTSDGSLEAEDVTSACSEAVTRSE